MTVGVRYREDTFELRCEECRRKQKACYWPLTMEFWNPSVSMRRCRACIAEGHRLAERRRRAANPEIDRQRVRAYRSENKDVLAFKARVRRSEMTAEERAIAAAKDAEWRRKNPERWRAIKARYRARHREQVNKWEREYARRRRAEARAA